MGEQTVYGFIVKKMKITKEVLELGKGDDDKYSDSQLRIFGFTQESCDRWEEKILGDEVPLWKIKMFQGLKNWTFVDKRKQRKLF